MIEEFHSMSELYKRVSPALRSKIEEWKNNGYFSTKEEIWEFLSSNKWRSSQRLTLYDIIDDIFQLKYEEFKENTPQMNQKTEGE